MKLIAENRSAFERCIDDSYGPETSIVSRYRNAMQFDGDTEKDGIFKKYLLENSILEGARIVHLLTYKGVTIHVLDETSRMATGSLKAIDGCLTTAHCRMEGAQRVAFESGGNSGSAFTRYGQQAGLETFFFCPLDNIDLLNSKLFDSSKAHLIGVEDRSLVKELTGLFAKTTQIRHVPDKSWRYAAAMFRGLFILEQMLASNKYDWISQAVSAGFGPIGIYKVLETFQSNISVLPRFLGIQQEANCPMFEAWRSEPSGVQDKTEPGEKLLTRVMYDNSPQTYRTYSDLQLLLQKSQGDLLTINMDEYDSYSDPAAEYGSLLELLQSQGIEITIRAGQVIEKTGIIALAGTLKAIDTGTIAAGSNVLCCLTSGVSDGDGLAQPEQIVRNAQDVSEYVKAVIPIPKLEMQEVD